MGIPTTKYLSSSQLRYDDVTHSSIDEMIAQHFIRICFHFFVSTIAVHLYIATYLLCTVKSLHRCQCCVFFSTLYLSLYFLFQQDLATSFTSTLQNTYTYLSRPSSNISINISFGQYFIESRSIYNGITYTRCIFSSYGIRNKKKNAFFFASI